MNRLLAAAVFLALLLAGTASYGQVPATGIYGGDDQVEIVRDEATKTITGSLNTCIQDGKICCTFNFTCHYRTLQDKELQFTTSWPEEPRDAIRGKLVCRSGREFNIRLESEPPGSMACHEINRGDGDQVSLLRNKEWKSIRMVRSRKAFFLNTHDEHSIRKAYVTMYDVVGILETRDGWVRAEYDNGNDNGATTTGWLKSSDLFPGL